MFDDLIHACEHDAAGSVGELVQFFLEECEIEQAPDAAVVARCRDILQARGGKFVRLATQCQEWLDELSL